nr:tetratricopeptide repeat protein [Merismopedia glauca]
MSLSLDPPDYFYTYYYRGILRQDLKQYREALADLDRVIQLQPDYAEAYNNRGLVRYQLKDYRGAIKDLQTAAELFEQQGNPEAYQFVQQTLRELPSSPR